MKSASWVYNLTIDKILSAFYFHALWINTISAKRFDLAYLNSISIKRLNKTNLNKVRVKVKSANQPVIFSNNLYNSTKSAQNLKMSQRKQDNETKIQRNVSVVLKK